MKKISPLISLFIILITVLTAEASAAATDIVSETPWFETMSNTLSSPGIWIVFFLLPPILYAGKLAIDDKVDIYKEIWNRKLLILYIFLAFIFILGFLLEEDAKKLMGATEIMATIVGAFMQFMYEKVTSKTKEEKLANQAKEQIVNENIGGGLQIALRTVEASSDRLKSLIELLSGKTEFEKKYNIIQIATLDISKSKYQIHQLINKIQDLTTTSKENKNDEYKKYQNLFDHFPSNRRLLRYLSVARKRALDVQEKLNLWRISTQDQDQDTQKENKLEIFDGVLEILMSDLTMADNTLVNSYGTIVTTIEDSPLKIALDKELPDSSDSSDSYQFIVSNSNKFSLIDKQSESDFEALAADIASISNLIRSQFQDKVLSVYKNNAIEVVTFGNEMSDHADAFDRGIERLQHLNSDKSVKELCIQAINE